MSEPEEEFTKIVVDLPNAEDGVGGEGLWSIALGGDLYEVRNSPWHCREINYLDVVRAIAPDDTKHPMVESIERRSGHRTVQIVVLNDGLTRKEELLTSVKQMGATYENANGVLFSLDFAPEIDWMPILKYLEKMQAEELLEYRTSAY